MYSCSGKSGLVCSHFNARQDALASKLAATAASLSGLASSLEKGKGIPENLQSSQLVKNMEKYIGKGSSTDLKLVKEFTKIVTNTIAVLKSGIGAYYDPKLKPGAGNSNYFIASSFGSRSPDEKVLLHEAIHVGNRLIDRGIGNHGAYGQGAAEAWGRQGASGGSMTSTEALTYAMGGRNPGDEP
jgi:hypothetical protein